MSYLCSAYIATWQHETSSCHVTAYANYQTLALPVTLSMAESTSGKHKYVSEPNSLARNGLLNQALAQALKN